MTTIRTRAGKGSALSATEYDDAVKRTPVAKSSNYTLDASHNREVHELGGSITTVTLPVVSRSFTETGDWFITLINTLDTTITIGRNGQTIDGASADITLNGKDKITIWMNSTYDGFYTNRRSWSPYYAVTAYRTTNISIPNATYTDLPFTSETHDSGSLHDTSVNPELFVAPSWATKMRMTGTIRWENNTTGVRGFRVVTSAGANLTPNHVVQEPGGADIAVTVNISTGLLNVTGGASYKIQVYQNSGGNLAILGIFNGTYVTVEFFP